MFAAYEDCAVVSGLLTERREVRFGLLEVAVDSFRDCISSYRVIAFKLLSVVSDSIILSPEALKFQTSGEAL